MLILTTRAVAARSVFSGTCRSSGLGMRMRWGEMQRVWRKPLLTSEQVQLAGRSHGLCARLQAGPPGKETDAEKGRSFREKCWGDQSQPSRRECRLEGKPRLLEYSSLQDAPGSPYMFPAPVLESAASPRAAQLKLFIAVFQK
ncbi:hypothetical protein HJG60_009607 [Phyllostomus discolor]|uniref:Uncharacterized protein n=1 Tax=Phyllostomus discolor TaxID=89673 RepID=A0A833YFF9_9CHIR|nr:hypothetical protein HJG60_009607 [Phyllostomus discolor]